MCGVLFGLSTGAERRSAQRLVAGEPSGDFSGVASRRLIDGSLREFPRLTPLPSKGRAAGPPVESDVFIRLSKRPVQLPLHSRLIVLDEGELKQNRARIQMNNLFLEHIC